MSLSQIFSRMPKGSRAAQVRVVGIRLGNKYNEPSNKAYFQNYDESQNHHAIWHPKNLEDGETIIPFTAKMIENAKDYEFHKPNFNDLKLSPLFVGVPNTLARKILKLVLETKEILGGQEKFSPMVEREIQRRALKAQLSSLNYEFSSMKKYSPQDFKNLRPASIVTLDLKESRKHVLTHVLLGGNLFEDKTAKIAVGRPYEGWGGGSRLLEELVCLNDATASLHHPQSLGLRALSA